MSPGWTPKSSNVAFSLSARKTCSEDNTQLLFFSLFFRNFVFIMIAHNLHHILCIYKARGLMNYLNTFLGDHLFACICFFLLASIRMYNW